MSEAIIFENVSYTYNDGEENAVKALNDVSISVHEGEFLALVGRNGSGKSTLAKMMNGLILPDKGKVISFGFDTQNKDTIFEVRKRVGLVFQNPDNQMVASIVEEDIAFGPENLGVKREEIIERVDFALKSVGMEEYRKSILRLQGSLRCFLRLLFSTSLPQCLTRKAEKKFSTWSKN